MKSEGKSRARERARSYSVSQSNDSRLDDGLARSVSRFHHICEYRLTHSCTYTVKDATLYIITMCRVIISNKNVRALSARNLMKRI